MSSRFFACLSVVLAGALLAPISLSAEPEDPPVRTPVPPTFFPGPAVPVREPAIIVSLMERVANHQLAYPDKRPVHHWARATGYLGVLATARLSNKPCSPFPSPINGVLAR